MCNSLFYIILIFCYYHFFISWIMIYFSWNCLLFSLIIDVREPVQHSIWLWLLFSQNQIMDSSSHFMILHGFGIITSIVIPTVVSAVIISNIYYHFNNATLCVDLKICSTVSLINKNEFFTKKSIYIYWKKPLFSRIYHSF